MKANELRIGNYISPKFITLISKDIDFLEVLTIIPQKGMDLKSYFTSDSHLDYSFIFGKWETVKPIPLTEEWLLKFGFEYVDEYEYWVKYDNRWNIKRSSIYNENSIEEQYSLCIEDYNFAHIKYVHQLQNLYFALTGKELEITTNDQRRSIR